MMFVTYQSCEPIGMRAYPLSCYIYKKDVWVSIRISQYLLMSHDVIYRYCFPSPFGGPSEFTLKKKERRENNCIVVFYL